MIRQTNKKKRGAAARNKGAAAERELANLIRDKWGYDVHRGKVFYKESDVTGLNGIHMEVKRQEATSVWAWMKQAVEEAIKRADGVPAVFFRRDRSEWMVMMRLDDWIDLYGAWQDGDSCE